MPDWDKATARVAKAVMKAGPRQTPGRLVYNQRKHAYTFRRDAAAAGSSAKAGRPSAQRAGGAAAGTTRMHNESSAAAAQPNGRQYVTVEYTASEDGAGFGGDGDTSVGGGEDNEYEEGVEYGEELDAVLPDGADAEPDAPPPPSRKQAVHAPPGHGRRRRLKESLYGSFNRRGGGNDRALKAAVHYLHALGLVHLGNVTARLLLVERRGCLTKGWKEAKQLAEKVAEDAAIRGEDSPGPKVWAVLCGRGARYFCVFFLTFYFVVGRGVVVSAQVLEGVLLASMRPQRLLQEAEVRGANAVGVRR